MDIGPCTEQSEWLRAFNAALNVVQTVAIAYLTNRAIRKNREESEGRMDQMKGD